MSQKNTCFTISFIDLNLALKMTPQEKREWSSGSLFLQDLKGAVSDKKTQVRVQTPINGRPCRPTTNGTSITPYGEVEHCQYVEAKPQQKCEVTYIGHLQERVCLSDNANAVTLFTAGGHFLQHFC